MNNLFTKMSKSDLDRLNAKNQSKLQEYLVQLSFYMRESEFKAHSLWQGIRENHKTVADTQKDWVLTKEYQHWKLCKSLYESMTNYVNAIRFEARQDKQLNN